MAHNSQVVVVLKKKTKPKPLPLTLILLRKISYFTLFSYFQVWAQRRQVEPRIVTLNVQFAIMDKFSAKWRFEKAMEDFKKSTK